MQKLWGETKISGTQRKKLRTFKKINRAESSKKDLFYGNNLLQQPFCFIQKFFCQNVVSLTLVIKNININPFKTAI